MEELLRYLVGLYDEDIYSFEAEKSDINLYAYLVYVRIKCDDGDKCIAVLSELDVQIIEQLIDEQPNDQLISVLNKINTAKKAANIK